MIIETAPRGRGEMEFPQPEHPLNSTIRSKMHQLVEAAAFRKIWQEHPGFEITYPLSGQDLQTAETISRLLPEATKLPWLQVSIRAGYRLWPPDTYPRNPQIIERMGVVTIKASDKIHPPDKPGEIGLAVDASYAVSGHKDDMIIFANVVFGKILRTVVDPQKEKGEEIDNADDARRVVDELIAISKKHRDEYQQNEERRKQKFLTPLQLAIVEAINAKGTVIRSRSYCRGFRDEFVLIGGTDEEDQLESLRIGFSPGNDNHKQTTWRDQDVLNNLRVSLPVNGSTVNFETTSRLRRVSKDEDDRYKAEGKLEIKGAEGSSSQKIPVRLIELGRETFFFDDTSEMVSRGFSHFVEHKADGIDPNDCKEPVLLATSIKI